MKTSIPISVWNLGSSAGDDLNFSRRSLWARMKAEIGRIAAMLPVFLVNEAQMDFLYPPERRRAIDPQRLREIFKSYSLQEYRDYLYLSNVLKELEHDCETYYKVVTVGLYIRLGGCAQKSRETVLQRGDTLFQKPEAGAAFMAATNPAILLCPERLVEWADKSNVPLDLVLAKVYYHELAHAYMDTPSGDVNPYSELWGRTVEESLANWIAIKQFKGTETIFVHRLTQHEPAEYQGYTLVGEQLFFSSIGSLLNISSQADEADRSKISRMMRDLIAFPWDLRDVGRINVNMWRMFKKNGARNYEVVESWRRFALLLLSEAVAVP